MSFLKNYRLVLVNQLQSLVKQWSQLVIKIQTAGPPSSGDSGWSVWVEPGNLFLIRPQVMLVWLVQGPHLKNH